MIGLQESVCYAWTPCIIQHSWRQQQQQLFVSGQKCFSFCVCLSVLFASASFFSSPPLESGLSAPPALVVLELSGRGNCLSFSLPFCCLFAALSPGTRSARPARRGDGWERRAWAASWPVPLFPHSSFYLCDHIHLTSTNTHTHTPHLEPPA